MLATPSGVQESGQDTDGGRHLKGAAQRSGCLLTVTVEICTSCGTIGEEPRVNDDSVLNGCAIAPLLTLVTFLVTKYVFGVGTGIAAGVAFLAGLLCPLVGKSIYRIRWSRINREMSIEECATCGVDELIEVPDAIE